MLRLFDLKKLHQKVLGQPFGGRRKIYDFRMTVKGDLF
jgi:hypothetical protein